MARPSFKPSDEQRELVKTWVKARISIEEMARRMEITAKTFRKHFADELGLIPAETVNTALDMARPRLEAFIPTDEQRLMVKVLGGLHIRREEIARVVGIGLPILEEHFGEILDNPGALKGEALTSLYHQVKAGNSSSTKALLSLIAMGESTAGFEAEQPASQGLLGKKAAAGIAAKTAEVGTGWDDLVDQSSKPN